MERGLFSYTHIFQYTPLGVNRLYALDAVCRSYSSFHSSNQASIKDYFQVKPVIPQLTLICVDCTPKVHLAVRAIELSLDQITPHCTKLLTDQNIKSDKFQTVIIPKITSLEDYSRFMIRELHHYIGTSHALVIQSDGYVLNGQAWNNNWLKDDYGGAPFNPSGTVGNGGFSLRSYRLLEACSHFPVGEDHPEDAAISLRFRWLLNGQGMRFMSAKTASSFAFEGRSWNSKEWQGVANQWDQQFGFHSLLSVLPPEHRRCNIFTHSGDAGDVIYGLATMASLGGGALFLTPDCRHPFPLPPRWTRTGGEASFVDNIRPLIEAQPYVERCSYTHGTPFSTSYDLNRFRQYWQNRTARDFDSIYDLHNRAFGVQRNPAIPWLTVTEPVTIPGRDIIVNRTARYHNDEVDWHSLVQVYSHRMAFIGTAQEASVFEGFAIPKPVVPWIKTGNMLDMARVIAGGKVFIGNQSAALAIAHGLGKRTICEEWPANRNCHLNRGDDAIYWNKGTVEIPESWLK